MTTPYEKERKMHMRYAIRILLEEHSEWSTNMIYRRMKEMYGNECYTRSKVYKWADRFRTGTTSMKDQSHDPHHLPTAVTYENILKAENLIKEDKHISVFPLIFKQGI